MNPANRIRGRKSQLAGDSFERIFYALAKNNGITITRVPNGGKMVRGRFMKAKSPFDWVMSYRGESAVIDTKTVDSDHWVPSDLIRRTAKGNNEHQFRELSAHAVAGEIDAGYVVWLRKTDEIVFVPAKVLLPQSQVQAILLGRLNKADIRLIFSGYRELAREYEKKLSQPTQIP